MPHRRGLKDPTSQLAESALGRLVLQGELADYMGAAGQLYRRHWLDYQQTLHAPRLATPRADSGHVISELCSNCDPQFCLCSARVRRWQAVRAALAGTGSSYHVNAVCLYDLPIASRDDLWLLRLGLELLARYFGLTTAKFGVVGNAASKQHG